MNIVYAGVAQQMASESEQSFSTTTEVCTSPSDNIALHRICGWALKSAIDKVTEQLKRQSNEQLKDILELLDALKVP